MSKYPGQTNEEHIGPYELVILNGVRGEPGHPVVDPPPLNRPMSWVRGGHLKEWTPFGPTRIPELREKFEAFARAYEAGCVAGADAGYAAGQRSGYLDGYDSGYTAGLKEGEGS